MSGDRTGNASKKGDGDRVSPTRAATRKSRLRRYSVWIGPLILVILGLLGFAYANYKFFRDVPQVACSDVERSEEHTSELQSLMRISYAVFCLKKKTTK